eukprot:1862494-Rhodomonas_salina.1
MESRTFGVSSQYQNRKPWEKNQRPSLAKKGQQHILGSSHDVVRNEVVNENVFRSSRPPVHTRHIPQLS